MDFLSQENDVLRLKIQYLEQKLNLCETIINGKNQLIERLEENINNLESKLSQRKDTTKNNEKFNQLQIENDLLKKLIQEKVTANEQELSVEPNHCDSRSSINDVDAKNTTQVNSHSFEEMSEFVIESDGDDEIIDETSDINGKDCVVKKRTRSIMPKPQFFVNLEKCNFNIIDVKESNKAEFLEQDVNINCLKITNFDRANLYKIVKFKEEVDLGFVEALLKYKIIEPLGLKINKKHSSSIKQSYRFVCYCKKHKYICSTKMYASYYVKNRIVLISWTGIICD
ncbi:unnamed protein product [Brachionus calyciflorus]|uniref:Uncharacterized protein n=1 Tax=Brachionus calyciflorus TaxID=104777 RepID=A0A814J2H6_9BILA|nr:unnamed protein product [Brachionus calyciflorus]